MNKSYLRALSDEAAADAKTATQEASLYANAALGLGETVLLLESLNCSTDASAQIAQVRKQRELAHNVTALYLEAAGDLQCESVKLYHASILGEDRE